MCLYSFGNQDGRSTGMMAVMVRVNGGSGCRMPDDDAPPQ
jgi:hypothetical protein